MNFSIFVDDMRTVVEIINVNDCILDKFKIFWTTPVAVLGETKFLLSQALNDDHNL